MRGHHVTLAASGREAIALWARCDYDFVLCDLLMPELTGMDVYEQVRAARPGAEQRMVFMTGGAFTERGQAFLATVPNQVLVKPFSPDELLRIVVDCALDGPLSAPDDVFLERFLCYLSLPGGGAPRSEPEGRVWGAGRQSQPAREPL
ncbi:MAG: response regulator [Polyangiaceae bacterium]|nr:response regulator [Polyangiaceae bacterium]